MQNKKRFQTIAERSKFAKRIMTFLTLCLAVGTVIQAKIIFNLILLWLHRPDGIPAGFILVIIFFITFFVALDSYLWWARTVTRKALIAWINTEPEEDETLPRL